MPVSRSYYYLVTGLSDIRLDEKGPLPPMDGFIAGADEDLHPDDKSLLRLMQCPYDNSNLISLLLYPERPFDSRGNFTAEDLAAEIRNPSSLPAYMEAFLADYRDGKQDGTLDHEDRLAADFYDSVVEHTNPFVREWFQFDLNLRNLLAAINCRALAKTLGVQSTALLESSIIGDNAVADALRRSSAPDFSLATLFPAVDTILALPRDDLTEFERQIDLMRMQTADDLSFLRGFKIDAVLAHAVKLNIAWRWRALDDGAGSDALDALVDSLAAVPVIDHGEAQ